jgi:hypothetical protein
MSFTRYLLTALLLLPLPLVAADSSTAERRAADTFILEKLRKQEGETWERVGQYLQWTYAFDRAGCELAVTRDADAGNRFLQRLPLDEAEPVDTQGSEIVWACRAGRSCIRYEIASRGPTELRQVSRSRLLVMDPADLQPLLNAFVALGRLCRDPYGLE